MGGERRFPGERLVDPRGRAVGLDQQVLGPGREAERRALQRPLGRDLAGSARGLRPRRDRLRERRLVAKAARHVDAAEQELQQMQRAAGLEAVGMGRDAAHRMHADRAPDHLLMAPAGRVGPGLVQHHRAGERDLRQLGRDPPDRRRRDPGRPCHRVGTVGGVEVALGQQLEHRPRVPLARQRDPALEVRPRVRIVRRADPLPRPVPAQRLAGAVAQDQAVVGAARVADHEPRGVGVAGQVVEIDAAGAQQLMDQRQHEQAVGAGGDAEPFVRDRRVAGAHRVDRDELDAAPLQLPERDLERVAGVVLGAAEQHEVAGMLPVRLTELPERAADGVDPRRGHVDRAEAAVGGVVGRAELARPPAGQRLALVAPGEERQLPRIARTDAAEPRRGRRQRLLPLDLLELGGAALANPLQRPGQARRGVVLHDTGRALGAQDAVVDRVVAVALDVADPAVLEVHFDAAAAGAHVAGGGLDLVRDRRRGVDRLASEQGTLHGT